jgi:uncharacterized protein with von Willebrand factor type A (vWA) domain
LHNVFVSICLLVDRSMPTPLPTFGWELCDLRSRIVLDLSEQLGSNTSAVIGYSEVAGRMSVQDVAQAGPDHVFGSNLQHAVLLARASNRETGTSRALLITYSLPSAHHVSGAQVFFNYPPAPESLEAAEREVSSAASEGTRIDVLLLVHPSDDEERTEALQQYFGQMSEHSGAELTLVHPGDPFKAVLRHLTIQ